MEELAKLIAEYVQLHQKEFEEWMKNRATKEANNDDHAKP